MKVEQFYNKNQFIIYGEGKIIFQSYNSTIAIINENGDLILGKDWDYSKTTLKHLYLFLNDYWFELNEPTKQLLIKFNYSNNKRKYIQKLIDDELIKMEEL